MNINVKTVFGAQKKIVSLFCIVILGLMNCGFKDEPFIEVLTPKAGLSIVKVNTTKATIMPYVSPELETIDTIINKTNAAVAINAGFFDPASKETMSYVIVNGQIIGDPSTNPKLTQNSKLKPYLAGILNRSEFRILQSDNGKLEYSITEHNAPVKKNYKILHSIQAGPMLFPSCDLCKESFVNKQNGKLVRHAADVLYSRPRTAIGIKGEYLYLITATGDASMTIEQLTNYLKNDLKLKSALAFDGGSSTSMEVKDANNTILSVTAYGENSDRKIKSALLVFGN